MSVLSRWASVAGRLASQSPSLNRALLASHSARGLATLPPTVANAGTLASQSPSLNRAFLASHSARGLATSPPTVANAGTLGAASGSSELVQPRGPGALPVGYIDDYHNHSHRYMPGDPTKRAFTYMVLGTTKFIAASAARVLVLKLIYTMSASADVLAKGSVEVDLGAIPLGESATIKWRGKPVFIRHRTDDEIALAKSDDDKELRHPELDIDRVQKPEWLIVLGVCTHLGCVPIANAGDYHGWFCPCHGSHYDVSGRIRKGPAPLNLDVPSYRFEEDDTKLILG